MSAGSGDEPGDLLACGTPTGDLLAQVAEGEGARRSAHQESCPHCRAALAEYERLWVPVAELAATPVHAPEGLLDDVLAQVRAAAGPSGWGRVEDETGPYLVAARVVVAVAGYAARSTDGVRMALGALQELADTLDPRDGTHDRRVEAGVIGRSVALELTVAAEYGQDLHALADRLRAHVVEAVLAVTGLRTTQVSVTVDDVFAPRVE